MLTFQARMLNIVNKYPFKSLLFTKDNTRYSPMKIAFAIVDQFVFLSSDLVIAIF